MILRCEAGRYLVGSPSDRGVVLTASYEARPYGVGSAMPMAKARRMCPNAVIIPPRFDRYQEVSTMIMEVFADFSPRRRGFKPRRSVPRYDGLRRALRRPRIHWDIA